MLESDHGTESINKKTQALFKFYNIERFETFNETKARKVKRFNRALKDRMYKYFTENRFKRCMDILPDLLHNYNHTYHRSIKMTPLQATENPGKAWDNLYSSKQFKTKPKFHSGDLVRISE